MRWDVGIVVMMTAVFCFNQSITERFYRENGTMTGCHDINVVFTTSSGGDGIKVWGHLKYKCILKSAQPFTG